MTESRATEPLATLHNGPLLRSARISLRALAAIAMIGGSVAFVGLADSSPAAANDTECTGVTVVVDLTDSGGALQFGCAEGVQLTGRDALLAAGFTTSDAEGGYICAINDVPNPCPETFDGNFWSYWHSTPTTEWTSYNVGADSSTPEVGTIEGWRYNDGTTAPGIAPAEVAAALAASSPSPPETAETPDAAPGSDETLTTTTLADTRAAQGTVLAVTAVSFLALIAVLAAFFVVRRRRGQAQSGHGASTESRSRDPEARG